MPLAFRAKNKRIEFWYNYKNNHFRKKLTSMDGFMIFPILISLFYLTIVAAVIYLIYTWVTKFISLKEEQNNLLREIIKRLENK